MQTPGYTTNATPVLERQNYVAMDRGDMYVPAGYVRSAMSVGTQLTPSIYGGTLTHSIPVTYAQPNANSRPRLIGMITPKGTVSSS